VTPKRVQALPKVREICMSLPEVTERLSHGSPTWFVRDKTTFATLWEDGHHQNQFPHLWCAAPPGVQGELVEAEPDRFFKPPYVGGRGWLGVRLDVPIDWDEMTLILEDAYRVVAPKKLIAELDARSG
jgi:hypothetical protein